MIDPISSAHEIFSEAASTLMAHTLRGTQNYFLRFSISLDVRIIADRFDVIGLSERLPSILQTRFFDKLPNRPATLIANIFIHRHANQNLARICIATTIFNLLLELHQFIQSGQQRWDGIKRTKSIEDQCSIFAWELTRKLDLSYRSKNTRERSYFPEELFLSHHAWFEDAWPPGLALDPQDPFYKKSNL